MHKLHEIRKTFLDFFIDHDHQLVSSSPLIPERDPTLLFTNAGMVQFKNVFTGAEKRDYLRAVTAQKCLRAGGKHNDLDNVGYTARHHTFFEMLGNFSFGDYFKEKAILLSWKLITDIYQLPKEKLLITIFAEDDEARELWRKISGFSDHRILGIKGSDNFWSMGDTGPCGPCSEIFYDHGDQVKGGPPGSADQDGDRFVEIWNLVFMQFERQQDQTKKQLPKPSIDTGMGLERMAAVMQGVHDNYDIDLFQNLIQASVDETGVKAKGEAKFSHRVIADHLRAIGFLIAEGLTPSNEGRGYVLRRIMRRAMRHVYLLGIKQPLIYRLVPVLTQEMGEAYPELKQAEQFIQQTLNAEETRFIQTLGKGMEILEEEILNLSGDCIFSGETAFKLYDTYGFPFDLTQDILRSREIGVDLDGFNQHMASQKQRARQAWKGSGSKAEETIWHALNEVYPKTQFLGYEHLSGSANLLAIVKDGKRQKSIQAGEYAECLFDSTPFYAESGGQDADKGHVLFENKAYAEILDVQKKKDHLFSHKLKLIKGSIEEGLKAELTVDRLVRERTRSNHSATHLLHAALREILGHQVVQKGQKVNEERIRFDFSFPRALSDQEIMEVEDRVNLIIRQNQNSQTELMALKDAKQKGAMALFGEKYGKQVRVQTIGYQPESLKMPYSIELCGGTHVRRSGDIAIFKIISENAIASGVRRIEAITGEQAFAYLRDQSRLAHQSSALLKTSVSELPDRIEQVLKEKKKLDRLLAETKKQFVLQQGKKNKSEDLENIGGIQFKGQILENIESKEIRSLIDESKTGLTKAVIVFIALNHNKLSIAIGVTKDISSKLSAVDLAGRASSLLGGKKGGGRADFAMTGGIGNQEKAEQILQRFKGAIKEF